MGARFWVPKPVCQSPKRPEYVTVNIWTQDQPKIILHVLRQEQAEKQ